MTAISKILTVGNIAYAGDTSLRTSPDSSISSGSPTFCVVVSYSWADKSGTTALPCDVSDVRFYDGTTNHYFTKQTSTSNSIYRAYMDEMASLGFATSIWTLSTDISGKTGSFRATKVSITSGTVLVPDEAIIYAHVFRGVVAASLQKASQQPDGVTYSTLNVPSPMGSSGVMIDAILASIGDSSFEESHICTSPTEGTDPPSSYDWTSPSCNVAHSALWLEGSTVAYELIPTGAYVDVVPGSANLIPPGNDFFCDPHTNLAAEDRDGLSWETPFKTLEELFGAFTAGNNDRGFCKAGRFSTTAAILKPPADVSVYGGFSRALRGTNAPIETRMWMTNRTIVDMISAYGEDTPWGCISYVTPGVNQSARFTIDGFHFYNCQNDQSSTAGYGGAINCNSQDGWKVLNCRFVNCATHSTGYGGAIMFTGEGTNGDTCQVVNCYFENCSAPGTSLGVGGGGGVALIGANAIVHGCKFLDCSGGSGGGLLIIDTADVNTIQVCEFTACEAVYKGGAVCILNNADAVNVLRCRMRESVDAGTVFYIAATQQGDLVSVKNSLIHDNAHSGIETNGDGYDNLSVINCTVANNGGTGIISAGSVIADSVTIYNSIIYGNTVAQIAGDVTACQYSDIEGGFTGTGNVDDDPLFAGADYHEPYALGADSDCVDGASSGVSGYDAEDLTGFTRTGTPDMGAIEYHPIIVGTVDATLYNFDMSSKSVSGNTFLPASFFKVPYLLHPAPSQLSDSTRRGREGEVDCYPLWVGSEFEIESSYTIVTEAIKQVTSQKIFYRSTTGPGSTSGQPAWTREFPDAIKSSAFSSRGWSYLATDGRPSHGITFSVYDEKTPLRYEDIQYAVTHKGNTSVEDNVRIFNLWLESHPQVERVTSEYCAKWLATYADVSEEDIPVSSGLMRELVRLLNLMIWERRSPLSVPVFGIYWVSGPDAPII